jgi:hypothetical protein
MTQATVNVDLQPDRSAILDWLSFWFRDCRRGLVEIAWMEPSGGGPRHAKHFPLSEIRRAAAFASDVNARPGGNVYACASAVSLQADHRASDEHFVEAPGPWIDRDEPPDAENPIATRGPFLPNATVVTGRIPYLREHHYFRLLEPTSDADLLRELNRRLAAHFGCDIAATNVSRLMRLPGSVAWPVKPGRVIELTSWSSSDVGPYSAAELLPLLPEEKKARVEIFDRCTYFDGSMKTGPIPRPTMAERISSIAPGNWHNPVRDIVAHKVVLGETDEEIHLIDAAITLPGWADDETRTDVQVLIDTARKKFGRLYDRGADPHYWDAKIPGGLIGAPISQEAAITEDTIRSLSAGELLRLEIPPRELLLAPWLPKAGAAMLFAPRGAGKTFVTMTAAYAVASGGSALRWSAPEPQRVLVVDGEMPLALLQERLAAISKGSETHLADENFLRFLPADFFRDGLPDLATPAGRAMVEFLVDSTDAALVIFDNLSCLAGARENEADDWRPMQDLVLSLRRRHVSSLIVHHAGKNGTQRGTSRREDVLDTVIALSPPKDYSPSDGARFEVHYQKNRGFFGSDAMPFEARLEIDASGACRWRCADLQQEQRDVAYEMFAAGKQAKDVERELKVSRARAYRYQKEWRAGPGVASCPISRSHLLEGETETP